MAAKHNISRAGQLFYGNGDNAVNHGLNHRPGVPIAPLTKVSLGSPVPLSTAALVSAATSTELPNASTKTYTTATDNTTPLDGAATAPSTVFLNGANVLVWVLDVPRNITSVNTKTGTTAALTITVTGYDVYGVPMTETITSPATSTSIVADGKKAFKWVYSIAIYSAADATSNTLSIGWGDVLGLPYALTAKSDLLTNSVYFNDVLEATAPTVVKADATTPATATTGDVRGTVLLASATNTVTIALMARFDPTSNLTQFGVTQV